VEPPSEAEHDLGDVAVNQVQGVEGDGGQQHALGEFEGADDAERHSPAGRLHDTTMRS
jgi:hypothetical protein